MTAKPPALDHVLTQSETVLWSHFLTGYHELKPRLRSYAELVVATLFIAVFVWLSIVTVEDIGRDGMSARYGIVFACAIIAAMMAVYSMIDTLTDLFFPSLRYIKTDRLFVITNERLLAIDRRGRTQQEMHLSDIMGIADMTPEPGSGSEWDEEDDDETDLMISRRGFGPYENAFSFYGLPDRDIVIKLIKQHIPEETAL